VNQQTRKNGELTKPLFLIILNLTQRHHIFIEAAGVRNLLAAASLLVLSCGAIKINVIDLDRMTITKLAALIAECEHR